MINASIGGTPNVTDSYSLTCYVAGGTVNGITYQWRKNNTAYGGGATIQFNALQLSDGGNYSCDVLVGNKNYSTYYNLMVKSKHTVVKVMQIILFWNYESSSQSNSHCDGTFDSK